MLTRETAKGWSDGLIKVVTGVGGLLAILIVLNNVFGWSVGGLWTGNRVETETLAIATKTANDAVTEKVKAVDTKVTEMQGTLKSMNEKLDRVPLMDQLLTDHTDKLRTLSQDVGELSKQLTNDERILSALVPGFTISPYSAPPPPLVRQPQGRHQ